jgi:hypothetical protein
MTKEQAANRLQNLQDCAASAMRLLESASRTTGVENDLRELAKTLRQELGDEYDRVVSSREQRSMTMFELSVYVPSIEDAWTKSKIKRLKVDQPPNESWSDSLEAVLYHLSKYA